ncbi:MAG TPA: metalloregulator ArsR/SmtB family transcription factor [Gemmatimonadaceae bacterium]|nr:metalloregulator ArsR/SmtB family transcription factor [Gemmatimonadaceae bacterium]
MSPNTRSTAAWRRKHAPIFAALGDPTRLEIVTKLGDGARRSIAELTEGTGLTRQAVTKHLRVLEEARIVREHHAGRARMFALDPEPILELREFVDQMSERWDRALERLRQMVEE